MNKLLDYFISTQIRKQESTFRLRLLRVTVTLRTEHYDVLRMPTRKARH